MGTLCAQLLLQIYADLFETVQVILMSTHNMRFYGEITKIIPKLSSNTLIIFSTAK